MSLHTVTLVYQVEAENWDLAIEEVLRSGQDHLKTCTCKTPGARRVYTAGSLVRDAARQIREESNEP